MFLAGLDELERGAMTRRRNYSQETESFLVASAMLPSHKRYSCKYGRGSTGRNRLLTLAVGLYCAASRCTTSAFSLALPRAASFEAGTAVGLSARCGVAGISLRSSFDGQRVLAGCAVGWAGAPAAAKQDRKMLRGGAAGALTMGIPKMFRWLTDQYPVISQRLDQGFNEVSGQETIAG